MSFKSVTDKLDLLVREMLNPDELFRSLVDRSEDDLRLPRSCSRSS